MIAGNPYTKFPGGGLEWGEGPLDCARREAEEELGQAIEVTGHFYTTDFFVESAFHLRTQVISIYYTALLQAEQGFRTTERLFDFQRGGPDEESFRWVAISHLNESDFHFPIDREVVNRLTGKGNGVVES